MNVYLSKRRKKKAIFPVLFLDSLSSLKYFFVSRSTICLFKKKKDKNQHETTTTTLVEIPM